VPLVARYERAAERHGRAQTAAEHIDTAVAHVDDTPAPPWRWRLVHPAERSGRVPGRGDERCVVMPGSRSPSILSAFRRLGEEHSGSVVPTHP
jgi:hypothetical protein